MLKIYDCKNYKNENCKELQKKLSEITRRYRKMIDKIENWTHLHIISIYSLILTDLKQMSHEIYYILYDFKAIYIPWG